MALLHALVSHGSTILAESSGSAHSDPEAGNTFSRVTTTLLNKIPPNDSKLSYQLEDYLVHYVRQNGLTALVMADADLPRRVAFGFLNELHKRFLANYTREEIADAEPLGMAASFNREISKLMDTFTSNPPSDPVRQAQEEINGVKAIMTQNIEAILSRGERIELLVDKTDNMSHQAAAFRKRSQVLRRKMWIKNTKLMLLTGFVVLAIIFILVSSARGGNSSH